MDVFVIGSTGRVATSLIGQLTADGHTVRAAARQPERVIKLSGVEPVAFDLHASVEEMQKLMTGVDAVLFVAGSRGRDLLQTDAFGAVKTMQAAESLGIKRYVLLSSLYALEPDKWSHPNLSKIMDYNVAKFFADNYLVTNTKLNYTIVQPGALSEKEGTGMITVTEDAYGSIAIEDVASVLAKSLSTPETIGKVIKIVEATTPIQKALEDL